MTKAFPDLAKNGQNISVASFLATCSLDLYTIEVEDELVAYNLVLVPKPKYNKRASDFGKIRRLFSFLNSLRLIFFESDYVRDKNSIKIMSVPHSYCLIHEVK